MMSRLTSCLAVLVVFVPVELTEASQISISVSGKADYHFAGQTPGDFPLRSTQYPTGDHHTFHGDGDNPNWLPPFVDVSEFSVIAVNAAGRWGYSYSGRSGPGGSGFFGNATHDEYDDFGISRLDAHANRLVGVFLSDSKPDPGNTPPILSSRTGDDMTQPLLQQSFDIGASLEGITVPEEATRLFFGLRDGFGWYDNVGSITVSVVPEPSTLALPVMGVVGLLAYGWRRRSIR